MNKETIFGIYKNLICLLPKKYRYPITIFDTTEEMIQQVALDLHKTPEKIKEYYDKYLNNKNTATYLKLRPIKAPTTWSDIAALSGNPIYISVEGVNNRWIKDEHIMFLILHEIGHNTLEKDTEKNCDLFAKKWLGRLINNKERINE